MWREERVNGKLVDVFEPADPVEGAVIYLHGHGGERLSEKPEFTELFQTHKLRVIAPQGGKAWWLDHVHESFDPETTPVQFLKEQLVPWIEETFGVEPPKIALFGISMGGQGVLNWSYRDARRFTIVAAIAPAIDFQILHGKGYEIEEMFESAEDARQETATLHIHPLNWPRYQFLACDPQDSWFESSTRLSSKLYSSGIPYESDFETSHGGHNWIYFTAMADKCMKFISQSLNQL